MTQLEYNLYQDAANVGMLSDLQPHTIVSACAESGIPFGSALTPGADAEKQVIIAAITGQTFRGIALSTWTQEQNSSGEGAYKDGDAVNVMKKGVAWVYVNGNVLVDGLAYFIFTGVDVGKFRGDATSADLVPTGVFRSSANAGELALLEINLP